MPSSARATLAAWLCLAVLLGADANARAEASPNEAADKAAREWLTLIDRGAYQRSWQQASTLFKNRVSDSAWQRQVEHARHDLGVPHERELIFATRTHRLPGVPDGDYTVLVYASRFDDAPRVVETVTLVRDEHTPKAAGYFIR